MEEQIATTQEKVIDKPSKHKHKIVYVDDEEHNLRVFKSLFRRFYDIILFSNPLEALEYLKKEDVSILISDQRMPEMKGTELIEEITKYKKELTTIILTGYSDMEVIKDAINKCDIYRFITKPYDFEELKADFNNALVTHDLRKDKEKLIGQVQAQNQELEERVKIRTAELGSTNKRLIESIKYAEKIQQSILTDESLLTGVFGEVMIYYRPLDIVSGDFYLFRRISEESRVGKECMTSCVCGL
ncbi:MAG: response regulator, partial [Bacteroidota bacterium]